MNDYLITPLAPLVLRGGKPVDANTGGDVLVFPQPSTLAGALRGIYAIQQNEDFATQRDKIEKRPAAGPLLAAVDGDKVTPLFAKPNDVFYSKPDDDAVESRDFSSPSTSSGCHPRNKKSLLSNLLQLHRLVPQAIGENQGCDLPDGLLPVFFQQRPKSKPVSGPAWWTQDNMTDWLCEEMPQQQEQIKQNDLGHAQLPTDVRYHIALDRETLSSAPGLLYQSAGRDFAALRKAKDLQQLNKRGWQAEHYALLARFDKKLEAGMLRLGGEGRLSALQSCNNAWPQMPAKLRQALKGQKHIRLILQTPALFQNGWRPAWLDKGEHPTIEGLKLKLCAAATERWQAISGWDIRAKKPKAVRRLVPAGSVYWFEILNNDFDDWDALWLTSLCDEACDRDSGFGLVVPGVWGVKP